MKRLSGPNCWRIVWSPVSLSSFPPIGRSVNRSDHGLLMAVRRGRVTRTKMEEFMQDIADLPIQFEPPRSPDDWPALVTLAEKHRLTTYDAAYLELAQRTGLPLATLDNDLRKARLVAARGRVKLLEKLREKRVEEWQAETDREIEELTARLFSVTMAA